MLFMIIRKEMLLNLVSFKFMVSIILLSVLIVGSMQMMAINYSRRLDDYNTGSEMHKKELETMSTRMQFEAFGVTMDPKPELLSIFSLGLEKQMSRSVMAPGYSMQGGGGGNDNQRIVMANSKLVGVMPEGSKYSNPIFELFMPPDFMYVINIVLSLLALLFSFDCISGEKEDQTLKLMLTNAIPRDIILIGKWIGGTLSIIIPFLLSFALGLLLVYVRQDVVFSEDAWTRVLLIMLTSMLYISVFFLLGMMFSTFSQRSSTSLILSLFAWVIFVLVIPNVAPVVARQVIPQKTSDQIVNEIQSMEYELRNKIQRASGEDRKALNKELNEGLPKKIQNMEQRWLNRLESQIDLAMNISRISPSANYLYAMSSISGTGVKDYISLRDKILAYREELGKTRDKFVRPDRSKPVPVMYIKVDMDKVPDFRDKRTDLMTSLNSMIIDIAVLAVYLIVLFLMSYIKFLNYDVK